MVNHYETKNTFFYISNETLQFILCVSILYAGDLLKIQKANTEKLTIHDSVSLKICKILENLLVRLRIAR